jgi:hypothetical protein
MTAARWIAVIFSAGLWVMVIDLIRRRQLTFKYAFAWLAVTSAAVVVGVDRRILPALTRWAGFELPSNLIFFTLLCVLIVLTLLMTVFLCQQNSRNDTLAQRIAQFENELTTLKEDGIKRRDSV